MLLFMLMYMHAPMELSITVDAILEMGSMNETLV